MEKVKMHMKKSALELRFASMEALCKGKERLAQWLLDKADEIENDIKQIDTP